MRSSGQDAHGRADPAEGGRCVLVGGVAGAPARRGTPLGGGSLAAAGRDLGAVDLGQLLGEGVRVRVLDLDDGELLPIAFDVERVEDREQSSDVALAVGDDDRVGRLVGDQRGVLRDQGFDRLGDRVGVDEAERDEARDEAVAIRGRAVVLDRVDARLLDVADRQDLVGVAGAEHQREALHLQHRLEDREGLVDGDLRRRHDRHAAAHAVVVDEVVPRHPRDGVDDHGQLDVGEIERDQLLAVGRLGERGRGDPSEPDREQERGGQEGEGMGTRRAHDD